MTLEERYKEETGKSEEEIYHTDEFSYRTDGYVFWLKNLINQLEGQQEDSAWLNC